MSMDSPLHLRKKNAPLNTHKEMHEWRFIANGWMTPANDLKDVHGLIGCKKNYKKLQIWCSMPKELWANTTKMALPHSKLLVKIG